MGRIILIVACLLATLSGISWAEENYDFFDCYELAESAWFNLQMRRYPCPPNSTISYNEYPRERERFIERLAHKLWGNPKEYEKLKKEMCGD